MFHSYNYISFFVPFFDIPVSLDVAITVPYHRYIQGVDNAAMVGQNEFS
jgi:hypothetical protein